MNNALKKMTVGVLAIAALVGGMSTGYTIAYDYNDKKIEAASVEWLANDVNIDNIAEAILTGYPEGFWVRDIMIATEGNLDRLGKKIVMVEEAADIDRITLGSVSYTLAEDMENVHDNGETVAELTKTIHGELLKHGYEIVKKDNK